MTQHLPLITIINGEPVDRDRVLAWELGRQQRVAKLLGYPAQSSELRDVDALRARLFELKRSLGPAELKRRLAPRIRLSNAGIAVATTLSAGRRIASSIRVQSPEGSAEDFADWMNAESAQSDSDAMLAACPDHFFIGEDEHGRQQVVETTGGSPLPTEFFIDYNDVSSLTTEASPDFPQQIAGVARTASGQAIGGVRHQFRNLPGGGFESWNTVEFPRLVGNGMANAHRWHLACEFGNWIEFQQFGRFHPTTTT